MIPLSLGRSPRSPAGVLHGLDRRRRVGARRRRAGRHRLARGRRPAASTSPASASAPTATTSSGAARDARCRRRDDHPRRRRTCPASSSTTSRTAFAALARALVDRQPRPHRHRHHRLVGQDLHQGPAGLGARRAAAPTVAPAGSLNSEVGVPLTVFRVTPHPVPRRRDGRPRHRPHRLPRRRSRHPPIGVVLNVGTAHVGEFGSREAIGAAKAELVAGAARHRRSRSSTLDDPVVAGHGGADRRARRQLVGTSRRRRRARHRHHPRRGRAPLASPLHTPDGAGRRSPCGLHGEHHVGNALAVAAAALECRHDAGRRSPRRSATRRPASPLADGGRTSAPTASPSSTTPTTPTPTRCARRSRRSRRWAAADAPGRCSARCSSWATTRPPSTTPSAGSRCASTSSGSSWSARSPGRSTAAPSRRAPGGEESAWVPDADAAHELLARRTSTAGDVVLFKSSRDAGLRWLGDRLVDLLKGSRAREGRADRRRSSRWWSRCWARRCSSSSSSGAATASSSATTAPPRTTPSAARPPWAARSSSAPRLAATALAHLLTAHPADGERRARAVPHGRAGPGRLPRRLHQDLQAAQPRACAASRSSPARRSSR